MTEKTLFRLAAYAVLYALYFILSNALQVSCLRSSIRAVFHSISLLGGWWTV